MRCLSLIAATLSLLLLGAAPKLHAQDLMATARALTREARHSDALKKYLEAVKIDPAIEDFDFVRINVPLDSVGDMTAEVEKAKPFAREALALYLARHPEEWLPTALLGDLLDAPAGEALLSKWLKTSPHDDEALLNRARIRMAAGRREAAIDDYEKLLARKPTDPERRYLLAVAIVEMIEREKLTAEQRAQYIYQAEKDLRLVRLLDSGSGGALFWMNRLRDVQAKTMTGAARAAFEHESATLQSDGAAMLRKYLSEHPRYDEYRVELTQGEKSRVVHDRAVLVLDRVPFRITFHLPVVTPVMLNVMGNDAIQRRAQRGFDPLEDCDPIVAFCGGTGMATENGHSRKELLSGSDRMYYLHYESPTDHTWNHVSLIEDEGGFFTLDVAMIDDTPIEKTTMPTLHAVAVVQLDEVRSVSSSELRRFTIRFR